MARLPTCIRRVAKLYQGLLETEETILWEGGVKTASQYFGVIGNFLRLMGTFDISRACFMVSVMGKYFVGSRISLTNKVIRV